MGKYETADYTVCEKEEHFEIRLYESFYTAVVEEFHSSDTSGFNSIFQYISGDNERREKIAMTVPVINEYKEQSVSTAFVMPHQYDAESLPLPTNPHIKIEKMKGRKVASVTFNGSVNDAQFKHQQELLLAWIASKNLKPVGHTRLARYNGPFTLPLLRKNEILIDIE